MSRHIRLLGLSALHKDIPSVPLIPRRYSTNITTILNKHTKDIETKLHLQWLESRPEGYIVYSDGSKLEDGRAGYGFVVYKDGIQIDSGSRQLDHREVFDAEISGALKGLKQAMAHNLERLPVTICIDNSSVVRGIGGTAPMSSQAQFRAFQAIGDEYPQLITVRWTPGHKDIPGNEAADSLAKAGAALPVRDLTASVSQRRREARAKLALLFREWWEGVDKHTYLDRKIDLKGDLLKLPELEMPRSQLRHLLAARTTHGDFADYHIRFHHHDASLECSCGRERSPTHLFYCRKVPVGLRARLTPDAQSAIGRFLGSQYKVFNRIADVYFKHICAQWC